MISIYLGFWKIAVPFLVIGFLGGYFEYDTCKTIGNLTFWESSYNHEWWYMLMYVEFLIIGYVMYRIKNKRLLSAISIVTALFALYTQHHYGIPFPEKLKHISGLLHYWPTFVLALNIYLWNLFEKVDSPVELVLSHKWARICIYMVIAVVIHYYAPQEWQFLQFFFYYMVVCFIKTEQWYGKVMMFFGKHSMNMWLMHTFICYYYWQEWFITISFGKLYIAFVNLTLLSLLTSIVTNAMYDKSVTVIRKYL